MAAVNSGPVPAARLPVDVLSLVLGHACLRSHRAICRLVCKAWAQAVDWSTRTLSLRSCPTANQCPVTSAVLRCLQRVEALHTLRLGPVISSSRTTLQAIFDLLTNLPSLRHLDLLYYAPSVTHVPARLQRLTQLEELRIRVLSASSASKLQGAAGHAAASAAASRQQRLLCRLPMLLGSLPSLASLELTNVPLSASGLKEVLRTCTCLRNLHLSGSSIDLSGLPPSAAAAASNAYGALANLIALHVDGCMGADAVLPLLPRLTHLTRVSLCGLDYAFAGAAGYHAHAPAPRGSGAGAGTAAGPALPPVGLLTALTALASLSLQAAFLRSLPSAALGALSQLTELDLAGNGLDELPEGLMALRRLRSLDLSRNELLVLPPWLARLRALRRVALHHNRLQQFPLVLYQLPALHHLTIGHNCLSWWPVELLFSGSVATAGATAAAAGLLILDDPSSPGGGSPGDEPEGFGGAPSSEDDGDDTDGGGGSGDEAHRAAAARKRAAARERRSGGDASGGGGGDSVFVLSLRSLDLSYNRLFGLPTMLTALTCLTCLKLREALVSLEHMAKAHALDVLSGLTTLRSLDLSSNGIDEHAVVVLSELRSLTQLALAENELAGLPLGMALALRRLRVLCLRANAFREAPVSLRSMASLESLDLSCNHLTSLPAWLGELACLRTLDLSNQYLVAVHEQLHDEVHGPRMYRLRLVAQPVHCLYGLLRGDLQPALTRLRRLRWLAVTRHPLGCRSRVLCTLQATGVDVVHPPAMQPSLLRRVAVLPTQLQGPFAGHGQQRQRGAWLGAMAAGPEALAAVLMVGRVLLPFAAAALLAWLHGGAAGGPPAPLAGLPLLPEALLAGALVLGLVGFAAAFHVCLLALTLLRWRSRQQHQHQ